MIKAQTIADPGTAILLWPSFCLLLVDAREKDGLPLQDDVPGQTDLLRLQLFFVYLLCEHLLLDRIAFRLMCVIINLPFRSGGRIFLIC